MTVTANFQTRSARRRRSFGYALASLPCFALVFVGAYWARFEGQLSIEHVRTILLTLPWFVIVKFTVFSRLKVYQGWSRYVTFYDLIRLAQAAVGSSLLLVMFHYCWFPALLIPNSVLLMDCLGTIALFSGLRSIGRYVQEWKLSRAAGRGRSRAFIVGANDSGENLLRAIRRNPKLSYQIVGFVSEDLHLLPSHIGGVPVVGTIERLDRLARHHRVEELLIAADECSGQQVRRIVRLAESVGVAVKVLPSYEQILHERVDFRPRTVSITDLLKRDPIKLDMRGLHQWIDGKVVLVTGSAGSIGSEICRQLRQFEPQRLVFVDRNENGQFYLQRELAAAGQLDVQFEIADAGDLNRMRALFQQHDPDIVFHAAAYKHVPLMEANPREAVQNIVAVTKNVADLSDEFGVDSFVMISTDKAVNPTSVMGACKRVAEIYVQALSSSTRCRFVTVRFGNVLDSAGSVVPIFREQIASGGPVTVTHSDMQRYFMMIPEASQLVIQAGALGGGGEIFVLDMGEPVRIIELAKDMIRLSGLEVGRDIEIEFTGLRPGEKLFEELHNCGEAHLPTVHPKILVADSSRQNVDGVRRAVQRLRRVADLSEDALLAELQRIVPQYRRSCQVSVDTADKVA